MPLHVLELPEALWENILPLLTSPARPQPALPLASTCKYLLRAVEAYCRKELARIASKHDLDGTDWMSRVKVNATTTARLHNDEDDWQEPDDDAVPSRRLLAAAYRTHLYSFKTDSVSKLAVDPDGKRLLSRGYITRNGGARLRLWDAEKPGTCLCAFSGISRLESESRCFSSGNEISIIGFDDEFGTWEREGATSEHSSFSIHTTFAMTASDEEVFLADCDARVVRAFNTRTGSSRSSPRHEWCTTGPWPGTWLVHLFLCGDYLLAAIHAEAVDRFGGHGIYLLDRASLVVVSSVETVYATVNSNVNGDVVAATEDGRIDVFCLEGNRLVLRTSFDRQGDWRHCEVEETILLVHQSRVYLKRPPSRRRSSSYVDVHSLRTGALERTFEFHHLLCVVASRETLFCGCYDKSYRDGRIDAYIL